MNVWVDGGLTEVAVVVEDGTVYHEEVAGMTNNEAEYAAVLLALHSIKYRPLTIHSDSQLVVNQLNHKYTIKKKELRQLALQVWANAQNVKFVWIPREKNLAGRLLG